MLRRILCLAAGLPPSVSYRFRAKNHLGPEKVNLVDPQDVHIVVVADGGFQERFLSQRQSMQCYAKKHNYRFVMLTGEGYWDHGKEILPPKEMVVKTNMEVSLAEKGRQTKPVPYFNETSFKKGAADCNKRYHEFFFKRHCILASYLEALPEDRPIAAVFVDSDIVPNRQGLSLSLDKWIKELRLGRSSSKHKKTPELTPQSANADVIFYERCWALEKQDNEVMAGSYITTNTAPALKFLRRWAEYEFRRPLGFSSADNGAIHLALAETALGIVKGAKIHREASMEKGSRSLIRVNGKSNATANSTVSCASGTALSKGACAPVGQIPSTESLLACQDVFKNLTAKIDNLHPYDQYLACVRNLFALNAGTPSHSLFESSPSRGILMEAPEDFGLHEGGQLRILREGVNRRESFGSAPLGAESEGGKKISLMQFGRRKGHSEKTTQQLWETLEQASKSKDTLGREGSLVETVEEPQNQKESPMILGLRALLVPRKRSWSPDPVPVCGLEGSPFNHGVKQKADALRMWANVEKCEPVQV